MADIRFTLRAMRAKGLIGSAAEQELVRRIKAIHFSARTRDELRWQGIDAFGRSRGAEVSATFEIQFVDGKRRDALALVARLADPSTRLPTPLPSDFPSTRHWRTQFVRELDDIPPLR
jgi:hypothetical protein